MKPVLLLVPGFLTDADVWADVAARLEADAEVRIADVGRQSSTAAMAADAWRQLADVPSTAPLVLCGFSMGGYVVIEMLATLARPVAGFALVSTSSRPEAADNVPVRQKTLAALRRDPERTVDGLLAFNLHPDSLNDAALVERVRAMMLRVGAETAARQIEAIVGRADRRDPIAALDLPALVLCAKDDKVLPPHLSAESAALLRRSTLTFIDAGGHLVPLEAPDAVADALRRFLHSLPT